MEKYDIAIIGCSPAGLSAAVFCGRTDLKTALIGIPEKSQLYCAQKIENYFGFPDGIDGAMLLNKGILHISKFGVKLLKDEIAAATASEQDGHKIFTMKTSRGEDIIAHSLIIATGAPLRLAGIENEDKFTGKGVHYCVWCDAPLYKKKKLAIIGSGDHAADEAVEALTYTNDITIISNADNFVFSENFRKEIEKWNIKTICAKVKSFKGDKKIESIVLEDNTEMSIDAAFVACGAADSNDFAENMGLKIKDNAIVVDENGMTSIEGIYAAGNWNVEGQVAKNVGDGCNAALSAIRYLRPRKLCNDYGHNVNKKTNETDEKEENDFEIIENNNEDNAEIEENVNEDDMKENLSNIDSETSIEKQLFNDENKNSYESLKLDNEKQETDSTFTDDITAVTVNETTTDEKRKLRRKLRIGWFSFSCCEDSTIVFTEMLNDYWDKWKDIIEIRYCRPLKKNNDMTELDIAFVEGAISNEKAANELRSIRLNSKKLVAIGACAVTGMPSGQRNDFDERRKREIDPIIKAFGYRKNVSALHEIVKVDDNVHGCPMLEATFLNLLNKYIKEFGLDA